MFGTLFASLRADNNNEAPAYRRKHSRRDCDQCIIKIDGKAYPVEDWSLGGFAIKTDGRVFSSAEPLDMTLKFKLSNKIIDIAHKAKIVRKGRNKVAFEFTPITRGVRGQLQSVVDDYVASQFARSQMA